MLAYYRFVLMDIAFKFGRPILSFIMEFAFHIVQYIPGLSIQSITLLTSSYRYHPHDRNHQLILRCQHLLDRTAYAKPGRQDALNRVRGRTLVLKNPRLRNGKIEKGVLLIKFTETIGAAFSLLDCAELEKYFYIVLEPSWSGYALPEIHCWMSLKNPVLVEASEKRDYDYICSLKSNLKAVRFGSSDWVDERIFFPLDDDKVKYFDSIYIANFNLMKRHHAYFRALANINVHDYKAALVCGAWGRHKEKILQMVRYFRLENIVEFFEDLPQTELNRLLNQSRLNVLMSLKEGSNRTIFEGLFSDTPGLVLEENVGVNKDYINRHTGYLVPETALAETLLHDRKRSNNHFRPRAWALKNISALKTTQKLNAELERLANLGNEPWTSGPVVKVNSPEATYYDASNIGRMWDGEMLVNLFARGQVDRARLRSNL